MYWIDATRIGGKGRGLCRVEYYHVHDDNSVHKATIITKNLSGEWVNVPGVYCDDIIVGCDSCGIIMQEEDDIKIVTE